MKGFSIELSGPGRLSARGELTFATAARASKAGSDLIGQDGRWVVDLAGIASGDSAGVAVLVEWLAAAKRCGASLSYENVPSQMLAIARISDIDGLLLGG